MDTDGSNDIDEGELDKLLFKYDFSKVKVKLLFSLMDKVYHSDGGINFTELFEFLKGLGKAEESISENISSEAGISTKIGSTHDEKNESSFIDSSNNDVTSTEIDREQTLKLAPPDQSTHTRVTIDSLSRGTFNSEVDSPTLNKKNSNLV